MNINTTKPFYQADARYVDGSYGESGKNIGKAMRETLSLLPQDIQETIRTTMRELNPSVTREAAKKISLIETSNLTVKDLTSAIMDIFQPGQSEKKSSYPSSFSVYA